MRLCAQKWKKERENGCKCKVSLPMGSRLLYSLFVSPSPARALPCLRTDSRAIFTSRPLISTWARRKIFQGSKIGADEEKSNRIARVRWGREQQKRCRITRIISTYVRTYVRTYVGQRPAYVRDAAFYRWASAPRLLPFSCPAA